MGHSPAKNLRALSRRNSWFSFNPNCMARSSITSWQTEDEVPDDVALDFGSTGFDGISARTEITVGPDAFVNGAGVAAGQLAIGSQQFLGELLDRKSTRLNSSHANISYAVFCLKKKRTTGGSTGPAATRSRPSGQLATRALGAGPART